MNGSNFDVYVNWSGSESPPCYFYGGQFDVFFNESLITYVGNSWGVIEGINATYAGFQNGTYSGDIGFVYVTTDWDTWIWANNNGNGINGSGYWVKYTFKPSETNTGTTYLNFSEARVPWEAIKIWDDGIEMDYIDATWLNSTVNVNP